MAQPLRTGSQMHPVTPLNTPPITDRHFMIAGGLSLAGEIVIGQIADFAALLEGEQADAPDEPLADFASMPLDPAPPGGLMQAELPVAKQGVAPAVSSLAISLSSAAGRAAPASAPAAGMAAGRSATGPAPLPQPEPSARDLATSPARADAATFALPAHAPPPGPVLWQAPGAPAEPSPPPVGTGFDAQAVGGTTGFAGPVEGARTPSRGGGRPVTLAPPSGEARLAGGSDAASEPVPHQSSPAASMSRIAGAGDAAAVLAAPASPARQIDPAGAVTVATALSPSAATQPEHVRFTIAHQQFGAVNLRLEPATDAGVAVTLSASDPDFLPAVHAALTERVEGSRTFADRQPAPDQHAGKQAGAGSLAQGDGLLQNDASHSGAGAPSSQRLTLPHLAPDAPERWQPDSSAAGRALEPGGRHGQRFA